MDKKWWWAGVGVLAVANGLVFYQNQELGQNPALRVPQEAQLATLDQHVLLEEQKVSMLLPQQQQRILDYLGRQLRAPKSAQLLETTLTTGREQISLTLGAQGSEPALQRTLGALEALSTKTQGAMVLTGYRLNGPRGELRATLSVVLLSTKSAKP
ncbi:type II secretion system protein M [Anthocerotibacter panamensis]|uniref:type II secretion system protein M n=1 Tax=Anthocerotibacter panamensis TaxID=2857077 RepID=UPI001C40641E|nr:type II secretion system protein M [Anthocerotibacter panamensis]